MSGTRPAEILRHLAGPEADGSDVELLHRFATNRDHATFASLVRRHGPLVLTICRKVAGHSQDAEDAFQAVFLVLARKAATLAHPERLGNWLHGVAVRVSQRARRTATRRRAHEVQVTAMPDPPSLDHEPIPDLGPMLHEELQQLPAWYRDAVLLCDLQGVSRSDAAKTLGIPEGTLSSRLAAGRRKLSERLAKRGITLAAGSVPLVLGEGVSFAAVPDSLIRKTCGLVADCAVGSTVPASVHTLIGGGFTVRKTLLIGAVVVVLAATGIAVMAQPKESATPMDNPKTIAAVDSIQPTDPELVPVEKPDEKTIAIGSPRIRKAFDLPIARVEEFAWSPDGKGLVIRDSQRTVPVKGGAEPQHRNTVFYTPDVTADPPTYYWATLQPAATLVGFSPDGKAVITAIREYNLISGFHKLQLWSIPATKPAVDERGELTLARTIDLDPDQTFGYNFARDGKTFRTVYRESKSPRVYSLLEVREVDAQTGRTTKSLAQVKGDLVSYVLSADSKVLITLGSSGSVIATDVDAGKHLWSADVKDAPIAGTIQASGQFGGGGSFNEPRGMLVLSQNGQSLLVSRGGIHQPVVLNAKNGELLPTPENIGLMVLQTQSCRMSADGRLLALGGERAVERIRGKGGFAPVSYESGGNFLSIWDTTTGKAIKSWSQDATASFLPNAPVLAVFEPTRGSTTRLGLWDFSSESPPKK